VLLVSVLPPPAVLCRQAENHLKRKHAADAAVAVESAHGKDDADVALPPPSPFAVFNSSASPGSHHAAALTSSGTGSEHHHHHHGPLRAVSVVRSFTRQATLLATQVSHQMHDPTDEGDIVNLLGPGLCLLTTPEAALATLNSMQMSRSSSLHHTRQSSGSRRDSLPVSRRSSWAAAHGTQPTVAEAPDEEAGGDTDGAAAGAHVTPFALHQQLVRQKTLARQATRNARDQQLRHRSSSSSSRGGGRIPSMNDAQEADVKVLPAAAEVALVSRSRCSWRLSHATCAHTPDLEARMEVKIEEHLAAQVRGRG
jgi:hypothetical protein